MTSQSNWPQTSRQSRGYGAAWDRLRKTILDRDHHICQCDECKRLDRARLATEVNHRKPVALGRDDRPENLHAVNSECHKRITAEQQGKSLKTKRIIGLDGYPIGIAHE